MAGTDRPTHCVTDVAERILIGLLTLGVGAWIGGFATVIMISRTSRSVLAPADRVAYFRRFGRGYVVVASVMILLVIVPSAILVSEDSVRPVAIATLAVACALVIITAVGIRQARKMTRLRTMALDAEDDRASDAVRRGASIAIVLRSMIGIGSLALIALALAIAV